MKSFVDCLTRPSVCLNAICQRLEFLFGASSYAGENFHQVCEGSLGYPRANLVTKEKRRHAQSVRLDHREICSSFNTRGQSVWCF